MTAAGTHTEGVEPLPAALDGRLLDHPVWWTDRAGCLLTVRFLHPPQLRPGEPQLRRTPDSIDIMVHFQDVTADQGVLTGLTTHRIALHGQDQDRPVRIFADGIVVPCRRITSTVPADPRVRGDNPLRTKLVHNLVPTGADSLRTSGSVVVSCTPVRFERVPADDVLAGELDVNIGDQVSHLERVWSANGEPMMLESSHLRSSPFGELPATTTLAEAFSTAFGEVVDRSVIYIEVASASHREAEMIATSIGAPVIVAHTISYNRSGAPMFRMRAHYRSDRVALAAVTHQTA